MSHRSITNHKALPYVGLVALAALYGSAPLWVQLTADVGDSVLQLWIRVMLAFLLLLPFPLGSGHALARKDWVLLITRVFTGWLLGTLFYYAACARSSAAEVAFLSSIPSAQLWAWAILGISLTLSMYLRWIVCCFGVALLYLQGPNFALSLGWDGKILALLSGLFLTLSSALCSLHTPRISTWHLTRIGVGMTSIILGIIIAANPVRIPDSISLLQLFYFAISAVHLIVCAFLAQYLARTLSTVTIGNVLTLEGVFAAVFAWLIFDQIPTLTLLLGGLFIIAASIERGTGQIEEAH